MGELILAIAVAVAFFLAAIVLRAMLDDAQDRLRALERENRALRANTSRSVLHRLDVQLAAAQEEQEDDRAT